MKEHFRSHIFIATFLLLIAGALIIGTWFVHWNQRDLEAQLHEKITTTQETLRTLAETTDRNDADEVIGGIIIDCARRPEFESLLVKLDTLSPRELISIQTLFESCGSFYAERKALMVAKLEREYTSYVDLLSLLAMLNEHDIASYQEPLWKELVELEKQRSALLTEQEHIQASIIEELIRGERVGGDTVRTLAENARNIAELLSVTGRQIDEKRALLNT